MPEPILNRRGFMLILSSPSGAGKTTISRLLLDRDSNLAMSVSVTTRPKRPNEEEGKDYYFVSKEDFVTQAARSNFLEYAEVFGHFYGTPKEKVEEELQKQKDVLFDIDWQGTRQITQNARKDVVSIFILPPSMEELGRRLKNRKQDSDEVIAKRMEKAGHEISHWKEYDYVIINYNLEDSLEKVLAIINAERVRRKRQQGLYDFVDELLSGKKE